jgi:hypothetical protein
MRTGVAARGRIQFQLCTGQCHYRKRPSRDKLACCCHHQALQACRCKYPNSQAHCKPCKSPYMSRSSRRRRRKLASCTRSRLRTVTPVRQGIYSCHCKLMEIRMSDMFPYRPHFLPLQHCMSPFRWHRPDKCHHIAFRNKHRQYNNQFRIQYRRCMLLPALL